MIKKKKCPYLSCCEHNRALSSVLIRVVQQNHLWEHPFACFNDDVMTKYVVSDSAQHFLSFCSNFLPWYWFLISNWYLLLDTHGAIEESMGTCPVCRNVFLAKDFEHVLGLVGSHSSQLVCHLTHYIILFVVCIMPLVCMINILDR
jgi:hypothetical protein